MGDRHHLRLYAQEVHVPLRHHRCAYPIRDRIGPEQQHDGGVGCWDRLRSNTDPRQA